MPFDAKSVEDDLSDVKLEFLGMELGQAWQRAEPVRAWGQLG
jgi:hypothetical protein